MHFKVRTLLVLTIVLVKPGCSHQSSSPELNVPEGFQVEIVAGPDLVDYPMFATLDETGRLFVFESTGNVYKTSQQAIDDPQFRIKLLVDQDGDGSYDKATVYADKLSFPQGGVFIDGSLIASSAPDLIKFTDIDGDGVADEKEVLLSGWTLNVNANSLIGPFLGPDGWLYLTSAIEGFDVTTNEGERMVGETARIWRVKPDGSQLEWISAGGMNNPVELTFTAAGEVIGTQTFFVDPQRGVRDAITHWTEGGIYGKQNSNIDRDGLPRTGDLLPVMNQYSRVAPVGIDHYQSAVFGERFVGDLFSTQFNTHQVVHHQLSREGGSFKLQDELFLWTDNTDFHPTDVMEHADGSLLVVETGGWFILGCPLSQVSKPQLEGAIYRITKSGMPVVEDPFGNNINWGSASMSELALYLEDARPFVARRSQRELLNLAEGAVSVFSELLQSSPSSSARIKALYGLYQINTEKAMQAMIPGFKDKDPEVRVACARAAGLTGSSVFLDELSQLLSDNDAAVVRQAATALGQIGEIEVIPDLLQVAERTDDRFVDHAVKYALISLDEPELLLAELPGATSRQKITILVALDQMPSGSLTAKTVLPYLDQPELKSTALWVASHHPEWAPEMIEYLVTYLISDRVTEEERMVYTSLINKYCGTPEMQEFLKFLVSEGDNEIRTMALKSMGQCQIDPFPESWRSEIGNLLSTSTDAGILMQAIELVKLRGLTGLTKPIDQIIDNEAYPVSLRVASIGAVAQQTGNLPESHFMLLCHQFTSKSSPVVMQRAAYSLSSVALSDQQLWYLTDEVLPVADPFVLPRLLPALEGADDIEIGTRLAGQLINLPSLDNFTEPYLRELFSEYPKQIDQPLNELLSELRAVRQERITRISTIEQAVGHGNEEKGRALYFGKATCSTCHSVREGGGTLGPDLTSIQKDRSVHDIIEAIVYPSVSFVREYETYKLNTETGEIRGIIKEQTPHMILMETAPGATVRISSDEIISIEQMDVSMMPQGLDQLLTDEEFSDLIAYLLAKDLEY